MNKSIGWLFVCLFGVGACHVETFEDCQEDDPFSDGDGCCHSDHAGSKPHPAPDASTGTGGSTAQAGSGSGASASTGATAAGGTAAAATGGTAASSAGSEAGGAAGAAANPPPASVCDQERDCAPGYNCNFDEHECQPADQETCGELDTEPACTNRKDCTPIYGGTNCSCGQDCECHGGEPGCVCESFRFFICQDAP